MKVFLSFLQGDPHHNIPGYTFWQYYIKNGIEEAGFEFLECVEVDWALGLVPQSTDSLKKWKADSWEKTIKYLKNNKVEIFLSYLYPQQIDVSAVKEIKKLGIFCINFYCDNVRDFTSVPKEFNIFDLNWVPEYKAIPMYKRANVPFVNLPMPMWVDFKYRNPSSIENTNISFIGSRDIQRQLLFETLAAKDIEIDIFGAGWNSNTEINVEINTNNFSEKIYNQYDFIVNNGLYAFKNKIMSKKYNKGLSPKLQALIRNKPTFSDYVDITRNSMITIGVNRYPSYQHPILRPNTYSRLRDIEAPMLGACYLTEWTEGLDDMYEIGYEIETYHNENDFIEKSKELEKNPIKRKALRVNGQKKALSNLSIINTLRVLKCYLQ